MNLPTWEEAEAAHDAKNATALQEFIYCNEPANEKDAAMFREQLVNVLTENFALTTDNSFHA